MAHDPTAPQGPEPAKVEAPGLDLETIVARAAKAPHDPSSLRVCVDALAAAQADLIAEIARLRTSNELITSQRDEARELVRATFGGQVWDSDRPALDERTEKAITRWDAEMPRGCGEPMPPDPPEPRCPTCDAPGPHLHPAVQCGGEVQPCRDDWHRRVTAENTPDKIATVDALQAPPEPPRDHSGSGLRSAEELRCTCIASKLTAPPDYHEPQCAFARTEQSAHRLVSPETWAGDLFNVSPGIVAAIQANARNATLEEAKAACGEIERQHSAALEGPYDQDGFRRAEEAMATARECATAVEALKTEPT